MLEPTPELQDDIGGAIGLSLLFHMPLLAGMVVAAAATCCILMFEGFGFRPLELNCSLLLISQAFDLPQGLVMVSERC
jgi:Mn2+/Fe2+ NRAMP family transporter